MIATAWPQDSRGRRLCTRCVYTDETPGISFDDKGMCNYCHLHNEMDRQYPTGEVGKQKLAEMAAVMREAGRGKPYDCILGVSGGCDSSFLAYQLVEMGLRPLAVHFDNTWNSPIATGNIYSVLDKLDIDLETLVVDNHEYDDIYRSFMLAGVPDIESPTDIGFMATLYRAAEKHGISHIVEGHSFRTEGVSPLGWLYMDGRYIRSVHEQFGTLPMKTYPNMPLGKFLKWSVVKQLKRHRPIYYMDYDKEATKAFLARELGWQWYGGHHLENRFTSFYHTYFMPKRWDVDMRRLGFGAAARTGAMAHSEAVALMEDEPHTDPEVLVMVKKRLGFTDDEFDAVMNLPKRRYTEFPTSKRTFERLKPLFWALYKLDRVPKSFYVKFAGGKP